MLFANSFFGGLFPDEDERAGQLQILFIATLAAWASFTLAGLLIRATLKRASAFRVVAVSLLFALTELVRISLIFALIGENPLAAEYSLAFRFAGSLSTGLLLLATLSTMLGDAAAYRDAFNSRTSSASSALAMLREVEANVAQTRVQILTQIRRTLNAELRAALVMSKNLKANATAVADELFRISDEVVRPLSSELSSSIAPDTRPEISEVSARVPFRELVHCATTVAPFRPFELTIVSALFTAPTLLLMNPPSLAIFWPLFLLAVFSFSVFGRKVVAPHLEHMPFVVRALLITALTAVPLPLFVALALVPSLEDLELSPLLLLYLGVIGAVIGWAIAISEGLRSAHSRILDELSELDRKVTWSNLRAQCQLWIDQKRLALTLHNTVQGNLLAAALKLRAAVEISPDATRRAIPEVQRLVASSLQLDPGAPERRSLGQVVDEINNTWSPLIDLVVECKPEVAAALESDQVALEISAELLSEFQTNSLKHGSSTKTVVEVTQSAPELIQLRMRNNGSPLEEDAATAGLGSRFIESVSVTHEFTSLPDGVQLILEIPLGAKGLLQGASALQKN